MLHTQAGLFPDVDSGFSGIPHCEGAVTVKVTQGRGPVLTQTNAMLALFKDASQDQSSLFF